MNTKKLFMLLAAVLLSSVSAMAQSGNNEPLKGDVNGDGVVDVADIAALIAIIKNNAATQTTYYWYVGQTDPSSMTSISPIIDDVNDTSSPGWRKIGTTLPTYGPSNKLWSGGSDGTDINMGSFRTSYLALPSNTIKVYSVGTDLTNDNYTMYNEPIEIDGVNYYIYTSKSNFKYFRFDLY